MRLSIVTTLYASAPYLGEFYRRITAAAEQITEDYELIFVNDGSPDQSLEVALNLAKGNARVVVADLSRNFGHHKAIRTGLSYASGERVFLIDCDLEEVPELLIEFNRRMDSGGADVVYGVQPARTGSLFRRWSGALYFWLVNALADTKIPRNFLLVRLMSRRYVGALLRYPERTFVFSCLSMLTGFAQQSVPVTRINKATTVYSYPRLARVLVDTIVCSGSRPLLLGALVGATAVAIGGASILLFPFAKGTGGEHSAGWILALVSVWLAGGLSALAAGSVGRRLAALLDEVRKRPLTTVRGYYGFPDSEIDNGPRERRPRP